MQTGGLCRGLHADAGTVYRPCRETWRLFVANVRFLAEYNICRYIALATSEPPRCLLRSISGTCLHVVSEIFFVSWNACGCRNRISAVQGNVAPVCSECAVLGGVQYMPLYRFSDVRDDAMSIAEYLRNLFACRFRSICCSGLCLGRTGGT